MAVGGVVNSTIIEPVQILYRGHNSALFALEAAAKTVAITPNGGLNGTYGGLPTNRPIGVLSGTVADLAAVSGENFGAGLCDQSTMPLGIFHLGYEGNAFENSPGVASGKVTVLRGQAVIKVFIWETRNNANSADLTYALGNLLYSSPNGLITNQDAGSQTSIGIVNHVPTTAENWLGIEMRI